jgi:RimJ/RimL family protein N-acetyltransferase
MAADLGTCCPWLSAVDCRLLLVCGPNAAHRHRRSQDSQATVGDRFEPFFVHVEGTAGADERPTDLGGYGATRHPGRRHVRALVQTATLPGPWAPSTIGRMDEFVPRDFDVPRRLETPQFVLEPLRPEHNEQDYDAWTSSMDHIAATPGWGESRWPREMTLDENRADLQRHADDFRSRRGFTYTVLDPANRDVIGCVYIYPLPDGDDDARALSWVRASHAALDVPLWRAVSDWLASDWPFGSVDYAPRA